MQMICGEGRDLIGVKGEHEEFHFLSFHFSAPIKVITAPFVGCSSVLLDLLEECLSVQTATAVLKPTNMNVIH